MQYFLLISKYVMKQVVSNKLSKGCAKDFYIMWVNCCWYIFYSYSYSLLIQGTSHIGSYSNDFRSMVIQSIYFHIIHSELINLLICFWAFSEFPCKYAGQHIATIHMRKGNSDIFLTLVSFSAAKSDFKTHMLTLY